MTSVTSGAAPSNTKMTCRYAKGELGLSQSVLLCKAKNNSHMANGPHHRILPPARVSQICLQRPLLLSSLLAECHVKSTFSLPHGENNAQWLRSIQSWKYKPTSLSCSLTINSPSKSVCMLICKISCRHLDRGRNCLLGKMNTQSPETRRDPWSEVRPPLEPLFHAFSVWSGVDDTIICPKLMQTVSATVA